MYRELALSLAAATVAGIAAPEAACALPLSQSLALQADVRPRSARDTALAVHLLNRLAFGPRPGDVESVLRIGVDNWIEQQLRADTVLDAAALTALKGCNVWHVPIVGASEMLSSLERFPYMRADGTMSMGSVVAGGAGLVSRDSARNIKNNPTGGLYLANGQLHACRLARVESSDWQLLEVMTDFWENHFSVHAQRLPIRSFLVEYDRVTVRPNALGKFRTLLGAVTRSSAMLYYLDNVVNSADSTRISLTPYKPPATQGLLMPSSIALTRPGLNENFARELLELHTLGVDGGYTQSDVIDVARAFTGWSHTHALPGGDDIAQLLATINNRGTAAFRFDSSRHDAETKMVLGHTLYSQRGMEDGEEVLDILSRHPATAGFIARKLVVRFVNDDPPRELVARAAATFTRTDGDIREVLRTIFSSDEFRSPKHHGAKVKSPHEFVLSLRRLLAAPPDTGAEGIDLLIELGQPPFGRFSPDGWPETAAPWMSVGAMGTRVSIATRVANGLVESIPVTQWPLYNTLVDAPFDVQLAGVVTNLFSGVISPGTRASLAAVNPVARGVTNITPLVRETALRELIAMSLGSPEFQRR